MPIRIAILNLMPFKLVTEQDLRRVLASAAPAMDITLLRIRSHTPTHTPLALLGDYTDIYAVADQAFDGMIITGAPVEMIAYEDVTYWDELTRVFRWAATHVRSTMYICWAAQAKLYFSYGIPKYQLAMKKFGVFRQTVLQPSEPLFQHFGDTFMMPHSRHTELHKEDIMQHSNLVPLAESDATGVSILMSNKGREVYVMGHFEYPADTLDNEYRRDKGKRDDVGIPINYYEGDNPNMKYIDTWSRQGKLFYRNWVTWYVAPKDKQRE